MINTTHLRITPLTLASGHGRYTTHNPHTRTVFRWGMAVAHNRYNFLKFFLTASPPKRLRDGRFTSETATWTWIQKWF
jgi:hypothetical protein